MTIRSAFERRSGSKKGLSQLRIGMRGQWLPIVVALATVPGFLLGQVTPGSIGTQSTGATSASAAARSAFPPGGGASAPAGYVLGPNDSVGVEVFGEDDLRTNGRLNPEGNLSVPLLGSIHLAGLTLTQAASRLTDLYGRDYLVNPKVNIMLVGYAKRRFTMLGQVNRPGSYEMPDGSPEGIDLLEAVAMAGGYTRIAAPERISIRRHGNSGRDEIIRVDAKRLARGDRGNFTILPGDAITVGESIF